MVDYSTYELLATGAAAGFFVFLAVVMLVRYRRISAKIASSADIGKDLWDSMESRFKKQDERILDVMTRMEVIQSRALEAAGKSQALTFSVTPPNSQPLTPPPTMGAPVRAPERSAEQRLVARPTVQRARGPGPGEIQALSQLAAGPKTSVEIQKLTGKSREHAARIMKDLYTQGLVIRDDSHKPFMYQLTDEGRRYLQGVPS